MLCAIRIVTPNLELITLLNQGVTPQVESPKTYFVFDPEWNSEVHNEIVTERQFREMKVKHYTDTTVHRFKMK